MKTVNMGILAHVDAGKTSLTERLLFDAGVLDELGSVDGGTTQTDSMDLERSRGITIRSAVVSFTVGDLTVNLIDTPGHSDFIAEVERALTVLDGAVLVVSAVEGVQAQTRVLMRTLARAKIPTLLFVNKIDRTGARYGDLLESIAAKLTPTAVAMASVSELGTKQARVHPFAFEDERFRKALTELLADNDDVFLADYVAADGRMGAGRCRRELIEQTGKALVTPVFFGSAMTGEGVGDLIAGIRDLLPGPDNTGAGLRGSVFKIERGAAGEKVAYARLFSGSLGLREHVSFYRNGDEHQAKVTGLRVFEQGRSVPVSRVDAGSIARVQGLDEIRIGDQLGSPRDEADEPFFRPPTFETVVRPRDPADEVPLYAALQMLAEQDPFIRTRKDELNREISVSLYGEVQKEVIKAQLESDFGLDVMFEETQVRYVEKPWGTGEALEVMGKGGNRIPATVGLRIEPAESGSGVGYRLGVELGGLPRAFHTAIEQSVRLALEQGNLGWEVTDCLVTLTHTGYFSPLTTAGDFRALTRIVLRQAVDQAGTRVFEPVDSFELDVPPETIAAVCAKLGEFGAAVRVDGGRLEGVIPAKGVHAFERQLPGLTQGEGAFLSRFDGFRATGLRPVRRRPAR
jgi:ribosomal protection tetracycline resistance protein